MRVSQLNRATMKSLKPFVLIIVLIMMVLCMDACTGLKTFPMTARAGDTIAIGVGLPYFYGGMPEKMSRGNTTVKIRRQSDNTLMYVLTPRAVFNLYPDPKSELTAMKTESSFNYSQAVETVVALDLPTDIPLDTYNVRVITSVAGQLRPITSALEIVGQGGSPHLFQDEFSGTPWSLGTLENRPYKEVLFSSSASTLGAVELALTFDNAVVSQYDIDVIKPLYYDGQKRMLYWKVVGNEIHVYILVPDGTSQADRLKFSVVTPKGADGAPDPDPGLTLIPSSIKVLDLNGNPVTDVTVSLN